MNVARPESLVDRTIEELRRLISAREIGPSLPGENRLSSQLGVSRRTLRSALLSLEDEGLIIPSRQGKARKINYDRVPDEPTSDTKHALGVILPAEHDDLSSGAKQLFYELEVGLRELNVSVRYHSPPVYQSDNPDHRLDVLRSEYPADVWLAYMAPASIAHYFKRVKAPSVMCGGPACAEGVPFCAYDGVATLRHAMGVLSRAGHRRICNVTRFNRPRHYEALRDEMTMREIEFKESEHVLHWKQDLDFLYQRLTQMLDEARRPTALIINGMDAMLVLYSVLNKLQLRVPDDISVIASGSDPLFEHFRPSLSYYSTSHTRLANGMIGMIQKYLKSPNVVPKDELLLMEYIQGGTVAAPSLND